VSTSANLEVATKDDKAKQIHALGRELKNALTNAKYRHQQNEHLMPQAKHSHPQQMLSHGNDYNFQLYAADVG